MTRGLDLTIHWRHRFGKVNHGETRQVQRDKLKFIQWIHTVRLYIAGFEREPSSYQQILLILSYMNGDNAAGRYADLFVL